MARRHKPEGLKREGSGASAGGSTRLIGRTTCQPESGRVRLAAVTVQHSLSGQSALIAGASGGLGTALAVELARRGATLTLVARDVDRLAAVPVDAQRVALDLRVPDACARAVEASIAHAGRLDVVVNAVGVVAFGNVVDLSIDAMEELFLTNTFVPIMLANAAIGRIEPRGAIVNISGVIAEQNLPGMAAYGASKAAVRSFDEALSREARRTKVRVLDARPGHTETGLADHPIEGASPKMPEGMAPAHVATVICDALEAGTNDLPSSAFT